MRIHTEVISKEVFDKYLKNQIEISYLKTLFDKTFNESKVLYDEVFSSDLTSWSDSAIEVAMEKTLCLFMESDCTNIVHGNF